MFTMLRICRPVNPFHAPSRTAVEKARMRSSTSCTSGTTFTPSTTIDASRGARSAVCSTARFSVTLIFSPANIARVRSESPHSRASAMRSAMRFRRRAVLRVVEKERRARRRHARAPLRIRGEELAQVHVADRLVVRHEREPRRARGERCRGRRAHGRKDSPPGGALPSVQRGKVPSSRYVVLAFCTAPSARAASGSAAACSNSM